LSAVPRIGVPLPEDAAPSEAALSPDPRGCPFAPRCPLAGAACLATCPSLQPLASSTHLCACLKAKP